MKKILIYLFAFVLALSPLYSVSASASQTTKLTKPVSSGTTLYQYTHQGTYTNQISHLAINLNDPYTKVEVGLPSVYGGLATTTALANSHSSDGHRVVGAVNAAFYDMSTGYPLYLISQNNEIYNGGILAKNDSGYVSYPIAFGVTSNGSAEIDTYDFTVTTVSKLGRIPLTGLNRQRQQDESILFTPQYHTSATNSNQYGVEYVVQTDEQITSTYFGQQLSGNIVQIRPYGSTQKLDIPKNGFVISVNGAQMAKFESLQVGDVMAVDISINETWQDASFMLASGPMLVRDGQRYITMDTSSSRAKEVAPRSAIAISKDKKTVHFVTVDGRLSNSKGMNLVQFADYLVSQGYDRAINLDGGGSTTMAYRNYGSNNVVVANRTSNSGGAERRVSAILEAISTAPLSDAKTLKYSRTNVGTLLVDSTSTVAIEYVLDQYYNPLPASSSNISFKSENGYVAFANTTIQAVSAGTDRVQILYNGKAVESFPITVTDTPGTMTISGSKDVVKDAATTYTLAAKDQVGNNLVYNPSQVKWSVEGDVGYINQDGKFVATKTGTGKIVAQLGNASTSMTVTVMDKAIFTDVPASHPYYKEVSYLVEKKYITGYGDGTFRPEQTLSRAHGAVIISRVLGLDTSKIKDPGFKDVKASHTYYKEIAAIQNAGIMDGLNGNFNPEGQLTRAQMAKIIANAFKLEGISSIQFKDVPKSDWAYEYVQALAAHDITTGYGGGIFKPNEKISRVHFGLFLYRVLNQ
ncbi:S-layer homology domain-containing protein [Lysinibacillus sp. LZ02]|uniref:S-layer homology domain-containing protein n=1 Tax=Lysinibacillus sp. LZ02 TaxID=3420668 RepID=UPI003D3647B3